MKTKTKIFVLILLPLLLVGGYLLYTIMGTFDRIEHARSNVFTQSIAEVQYAADLRFQNVYLDNRLYEMIVAYANNDQNQLLTAAQLYRDLQQQRYHSLEQLKNIIATGGPITDSTIGIIDVNRGILFHQISDLITETNLDNEKIVVSLGLSPRFPGEYTEVGETLAHDAVPQRRELSGKLTEFIESRYQKMRETNLIVEEVERKAVLTLSMITLLGIIVGVLVALIINTMVVKPLERLTRAIETGKPGMQLLPHERLRQDEIGLIIRTIETRLEKDLWEREKELADAAKKKEKS